MTWGLAFAGRKRLALDTGDDWATRDEAVKVALEYARKHPETLVIVTGDHAHTSQIVDLDTTPTGFSSQLITNEGETMMVTYGTGNTPSGQEHTGMQIRVAARGPHATRVVGLIDQTDIFRIFTQAMRLSTTGSGA